MKRPALTLILLLIQVLGAVLVGGLAQREEVLPSIRIVGLEFLPEEEGTRVQVRFEVTETSGYSLLRGRLDRRSAVPWKGNHVHIGVSGTGFRIEDLDPDNLDLVSQFFVTHYRGSNLDSDSDPFTFIIQVDQEADDAGQAARAMYLLDSERRRRGQDALLQSGETYTVRLWLVNSAHLQIDIPADGQSGQSAIGLENNPDASSTVTFSVP